MARPFKNSDVLEKAKLPTKTCVAKLFALKGSDLLGAGIDARSAGITLRGIGLAANMTEGCH